MIENDLRDTFARHEHLAPDPGPLRRAIDETTGRRRRLRLISRSVGAALAVTAVLAVPTLISGETGNAAPVEVASSVSPPPVAVVAADRPLNVLLIGADGDGADARADTVLVAHVPAGRDAVYLVSLPRDRDVPIPGHDRDTLSRTFMLGGPDLTETTVRELTGMTFDGTVTVRYSAVEAITDAVGGVELCLDQEVVSWHTHRRYAAGCSDFDGAAAIDLLRQRYGLDQDSYDRDRNGQRYLRAIAAKAAGASLLELVRAAGDGLSLDQGGLELVTAIAGMNLDGKPVVGIAAARPGTDLPDTLFEALRGGAMSGWVDAHPDYLTR
ncbi:LCP family protein required for cell wall assembly [Catenuloplanes nepalensis]|uniref:LCP family protein required for cell wall assembly n=1 Tax=Catenuloplanes nepalensis TaxID=587533 RepID=A0ABT9N4N2_9ACTN|nr:LCP family protein [Catenuloplanes nepalensis]MDP9798376.1 LCP family protein required for cell wall assembly [Catenuloplanes nepalensis]